MIYPQTDRDSIEILATEFIEDCRGREEPPIDEYCARYPHLADKINALFPMIAALETMKKADDQAAAQNATTRPLHLTQLGDFKIYKEIGRGGMGIVYQAWQQTLDRHVALKVLPKASLLAAESLQRFRQEARMAARLHHSNIVSLYGVGEHDGYHFLVMELVDGVSLDKVIRRLAKSNSSEAVSLDLEHPFIAQIATPFLENAGGKRWKKIAALGRDAAQALQFAFENNVLHRDVKPANVLLDLDGRVWISDFGLAQPPAEAPLSDKASATTTRLVGGTPRYLPPESIYGEFDQRGDVYGLGLTLYELLTHQAAFTENTPQETAARLAKADSNNNSIPTSLREIDPKIPPDLEAIVLKSIARSPKDRYDSAGSMARDLDRFVSGCPVKARPIPWFKRLGRWCQRNPTVASLSAATATLLLLVATVSTAGYYNAIRNEEAVNNALKREVAASQQFESTLKVATHSLDEIYARFALSQVNEKSMPSIDELIFSSDQQERSSFSSDTAAILESLLDFYRVIAKDNDGVDTIDRASARVLEKIGDVHLQLGHPERAMQHIQQAIDAWNSIAQLHPEDTTPAVSVGRLHIDAGRVAAFWRDYDSADTFYREALTILDAIPKPHADATYEKARSLYFIGHERQTPASAIAEGNLSGPRLRQTGQSDKGQDATSRSVDHKTEVLPKPPRPLKSKETQALRRAITLLQESSADRKQPDFQFLLACCRRELKSHIERRYDKKRSSKGNAPEDVSTDDNVAKILSNLVEQYPENANYRYELVETLRRGGPLGQSNLETQTRQLEDIDLAVEHIEALVWQHPNNPRFIESRMHVHHRRGHILNYMARDPELSLEKKKDLLLRAMVSLRKSSTDVRHLVAGWPRSDSWQLWSVIIEASAGDVLIQLERNKSSVSRLIRSVQALEKICSDKKVSKRFHNEVPVIGRVLIRLAQKLNKKDLVQQIQTGLDQATKVQMQ